jgi:DNA polymerase
MLEAVIDYESRSKADLKAVGAINYARDESTSIFCLGYRVACGPYRLWIPERAPMPEALWAVFKAGILVAHNASFERAITRYTLTRYPLLTSEQKEVLIRIPPSRWRCTAAKAAMCHLPRNLEEAAQALGLPVQKNMEGNRLIKKYSKPRKPSKHNPSPWWTDRSDLRKIYRYCLTDVKAEYELHMALPDLSDSEQKIWELDQKINDRGVLIDIPTVKIILNLIREEMENITQGVNELTNGEITSVTQTAKVLQWVNERGADMENLQAATLRDKLMEDNLSDEVRQMLEFRQGGSKTSTAKYQAMLEAVGDDNRARELLLYCGASPTARWSGKRVQPQNMVRGHLKFEDVKKVIHAIQA